MREMNSISRQIRQHRTLVNKKNPPEIRLVESHPVYKRKTFGNTIIYAVRRFVTLPRVI